MRLRTLAVAIVCTTSLFAAKDDVVKRLSTSAEVFGEITKIDDKGIPRELLEKAQCVVIVPDMKRAGFIVGAKYGKGFMTCRAGRAWSAPSAVRIEGGSIGAQIGAGETDVVLVVMNKNGAEKLMRSEFTLGGEVGVMAGPVGRDSSAQTDALMNAEILSYSRARGLFAGIALTGSTLRADDKDNEDLYGKPIEHKTILMGKVTRPAEAKVLFTSLNRFPATKAGTRSRSTKN
ncbi:MAG: lipid-binding SYLF domain-containing protein [Bryobacteraceae bacterium]|nr:lipid-binding SYLF domain-containing protein [Bryobacteraceae bacterium]